jgi:hypothetical protein
VEAASAAMTVAGISLGNTLLDSDGPVYRAENDPPAP